jgi:uncharacterized protein YbaR (Trm112 family)
MLVCPSCKGELEYAAEPEALVCLPCRLRYPVQDGIPVMLIEEAEKIGAQGPEGE